MEIWIARHGETDKNKNGIWQGYEGSLTEKGVIQAQKLAEFMSTENIERIYSSDMPRALCTARIIEKKVGLIETRIEPLLRERGIGEIEGLRYDEVPVKLSVPNMTITSKLLDFIGGAEKLNDFQFRVEQILSRAASDNEDKLLVSHGGVMGFLLKLFGYDLNVKNCDAILIEKNGGTFRLKRYYVNEANLAIDMVRDTDAMPAYFFE
ncbi:MAG: histidine phosphatase family protein [Thermoplasmata archaeon]